jgi:glyoxylase-like metal-dependent hydrolase (beta-lactamase superfamily II)
MTGLSVDIRCYCHGLGDCMLLSLPKADGSAFWMLIDCGVHSAAKGGADKMREVVADIAERTNGHIDVIVGTHEHWDHLSGFIQAAEAFAGVTVGEVWFSWAENPADPDARKLDKYKGDAASALAAASFHMAGVKELEGTAKGIEALLGFVFGAKGEKVRDARERLRRLAPVVRHLEPGTLAPLAGVPGVRVYVLGPPRDPRLLGIEDIVSETYALGGRSASAAPLANAFDLNAATLRIDDDPSAPFDGTVGLSFTELAHGKWPEDQAAAFFWNHYFGPETAGGAERDQTWRRIDADWLASSAELALQLDSRTNNTSLVLAFEIVETGRVLLFAADAQVGNWMSWSQVTFPATAERPARTADELLRRTVFYKVGHHGSRNATRAAALEMMDHSALVAFSPTDESLAGKVGWKDFPAPKTSARLREVTSGRFIPSDAAWIHDAGLPVPVAPGGALRTIHVEHGKYVDLTLA